MKFLLFSWFLLLSLLPVVFTTDGQCPNDQSLLFLVCQGFLLGIQVLIAALLGQAGPFKLSQSVEIELQAFTNSSYKGNSGLCGLPLSQSCTDVSKVTPSPNPRKESSKSEKEASSGNGVDWVCLGCRLVGFVIGLYSEKVFQGHIEKFESKKWGLNEV
ncbi:hypothetical protein GIB67_014309 [Kingdonia uniflora]|uniref:Uncharacterized protein n=1 Tax=Kingdonia uniflora TaxID=39325 RepID=A0A7J7NT94_9MAGN|nr:hypothetical protein GIB67_014309 [Kingdonia uniflora]